MDKVNWLSDNMHVNVVNNFIEILKNDLTNNNITFKENNRELILLCPFCLSENKYKLKLYVNKEILLYHCFRCEVKGNVFNFIRIFNEYKKHGIELENAVRYYQKILLSDETVNHILKYSSRKNKYISFVNYFSQEEEVVNFSYNYSLALEEFSKIKEVANQNEVFDSNVKYLSKRLVLDSNYIKFYLNKDKNLRELILLNLKENEIYNFTFYKFYSEKRNIASSYTRYFKYKIIELLNGKENGNSSISNDISFKNQFFTTYPDFSLIKLKEKFSKNEEKSLIITEGIFDLLSLYFYGIESFIDYLVRKSKYFNVNSQKKFLESVLNTDIYLSHLSGYKNYERFFYFVKMLYYTHGLKFKNIILILDKDINLKSMDYINNTIKNIYILHLENLYGNVNINFNVYRVNFFAGKDINDIVNYR